MIISFTHKCRFIRQFWRGQILNAIIALLFLSCSTLAYATKLSGYVTNIDTSSTFRIGTMAIELDANTRCVRIPISQLQVSPADSSFSSPGTGYTIYNHKATSISCRADELAIGTLVRISGRHTTSGYFLAQEIVELSATNRISQGHGRNDKCPETAASISVIDPDYARRTPGRIIASHGKSISIIPSSDVQQAVEKVGHDVATTWQKELLNLSCNTIHFRFYVVPYGDVIHSAEFISIDGTLPYNTSDWGASEYKYDISKSSKRIGNALALTNGIIIVPDKVLTRLHNQAQLASLLSYSIASVMQNGISEAAIIAQSNNRKDIRSKFSEILEINKLVIQKGISQMYSAGFDIREAPFTWSMADGVDVRNPVVGTYILGKDLPWYTSYSFDYISQYYRDADYSKLKRGEAEYQQLLADLRRDDPEAFTGDSASARR